MSAPRPSVKGWCPGALQPMRSGDGLVVRLRLSGGILTAKLARAIGELARRYGNGQIDLTQRANLQIRGVSDATWPDLIADLADLGVLDADAETEAARNIIASPLAGIDPAAVVDGIAITQALEARLTTDPMFRQLPGKFGFVVDDGGSLPLDGITADIRFVGVDGRIAVEIGDFWRLGLVAPADIGDAAARLAMAFLSLRGDGPAAHKRMLGIVAAKGAAAVAEAAGFTSDGARQRLARQDAPVIGLLGERLLGLGVPFGRLTSQGLARLADVADSNGTGVIRLTPWRAVLLPGVRDMPSDHLSAAGFIISPADPRLAVVACPGAPECSSGTRPVRDDALALSRLAATLPGEGVRLHVSGCAKGCARPRSSAVTLVARENGYDLVQNGRTSDHPTSTGLTRQDIEGVLRTLTSEETEPV